MRLHYATKRNKKAENETVAFKETFCVNEMCQQLFSANYQGTKPVQMCSKMIKKCMNRSGHLTLSVTLPLFFLPLVG